MLWPLVTRRTYEAMQRRWLDRVRDRNDEHIARTKAEAERDAAVASRAEAIAARNEANQERDQARRFAGHVQALLVATLWQWPRANRISLHSSAVESAVRAGVSVDVQSDEGMLHLSVDPEPRWAKVTSPAAAGKAVPS